MLGTPHLANSAQCSESYTIASSQLEKGILSCKDAIGVYAFTDWGKEPLQKDNWQKANSFYFHGNPQSGSRYADRLATLCNRLATLLPRLYCVELGSTAAHPLCPWCERNATTWNVFVVAASTNRGMHTGAAKTAQAKKACHERPPYGEPQLIKCDTWSL